MDEYRKKTLLIECLSLGIKCFVKAILSYDLGGTYQLFFG